MNSKKLVVDEVEVEVEVEGEREGTWYKTEHVCNCDMDYYDFYYNNI